MARPSCYWCFENADFIDTLTTRCPMCIPELKIAEAKLVSVQSAEGALTARRAREGARAMRESAIKQYETGGPPRKAEG